MRIQPLAVFRILAPALFLAGCAASSSLTSKPGAAATAADSGMVVIDLTLRRSAELADSRGNLRVLDQDLRVEYRRGGRGRGLDAGAVSLAGRPLHRSVGGKGEVSYRLGRDEPEGGTQATDDPWLTLANDGGPGVPGAEARVKLAPYPVVTQPTPEQGVLRSEELAVVMLPPVAEVWYRVSLVGAGDTVTALDLGQGRWLFARGTLEPLTAGRARILIEVETSCGGCDVARGLRANWSSRTELEVPVTLL